MVIFLFFLKIIFFEFFIYIYIILYWNIIVVLVLGKKIDKKIIIYMYNNNCLFGRWFVIIYFFVDVLDGKCN